MSLENIKVFQLAPEGGHIELLSLEDKEALVYGKYGAAFRQPQVAAGQKVYRLVELWEKTGHSSLITRVLGLDNKPLSGIKVTFYWPGADPFPFPCNNDWYANFIVGETNANGEVGPGMGKGAYHGEGEGGPHAVWVHDPDIPSYIVERLGMLGMTNHDHLDQVLRLEIVGDQPEPPPEPPSPPPPGPPPEPGWTVEEKRLAAPGLRLVIGHMDVPGVTITATDPWGHRVTTRSGEKPGYGAGGWEFAFTHPGLCSIEFLGEHLSVQVDHNTAVHLYFQEGPAPEPPPEPEPPVQARVVTNWMDKADAEAMQQALSQQYPGVAFSLES